MANAEPGMSPQEASRRLGDWGFLAHADLPDRQGPAYLIVALPDRPSLRHFDPELVQFWRTRSGRGVRDSLDRSTRLPASLPVAWGDIRITDRLAAENDYVTFGGSLTADRVEDRVVAVLVSEAPILRAGGHSQLIDPAAPEVAAFFARLRSAVLERPGLEARAGDIAPVVLYAAFLQDREARVHRRESLIATRPELDALLATESWRLRTSAAEAWRAATDLRTAAGWEPAAA